MIFLNTVNKNIITKTFLYKQIRIYNRKIFIQKNVNQTPLFTKMSVYVPSKILGKNIHDSAKNRKRKAKKKNKK